MRRSGSEIETAQGGISFQLSSWEGKRTEKSGGEKFSGSRFFRHSKIGRKTKRKVMIGSWRNRNTDFVLLSILGSLIYLLWV